MISQALRAQANVFFHHAQGQQFLASPIYTFVLVLHGKDARTHE